MFYNILYSSLDRLQFINELRLDENWYVEITLYYTYWSDAAIVRFWDNLKELWYYTVKLF